MAWLPELLLGFATLQASGLQCLTNVGCPVGQEFCTEQCQAHQASCVANSLLNMRGQRVNIHYACAAVENCSSSCHLSEIKPKIFHCCCSEDSCNTVSPSPTPPSPAVPVPTAIPNSTCSQLGCDHSCVIHDGQPRCACGDGYSLNGTKCIGEGYGMRGRICTWDRPTGVCVTLNTVVLQTLMNVQEALTSVQRMPLALTRREGMSVSVISTLVSESQPMATTVNVSPWDCLNYMDVPLLEAVFNLPIRTSSPHRSSLSQMLALCVVATA